MPIDLNYLHPLVHILDADQGDRPFFRAYRLQFHAIGEQRQGFMLYFAAVDSFHPKRLVL